MINFLMNKENYWSIVLQKLIFSIAGLFLFCLTSCMEVENRVILQMDGSAVIKETIKIHKELLDFTDESGKPIVMVYLEKAACEERAKVFGTGVELRNHSIKNLMSGVKTMEAEYYIPKISDLYIVNPYLCFLNYKEAGRGKFNVEGIYKEWNRGRISVTISSEVKGVGQPRIEDTSRLKPPSPATLQVYRDLQPAFKILMKDLKVSFVFESYAPILVTAHGIRNPSSRPRVCEILSFSGSDIDLSGDLILDNDEIMPELLQQKFWDYNIAVAAKSFPYNNKLPVIMVSGSPYSNYSTDANRKCTYMFKPSKSYFKTFFEGKFVDLTPDPRLGTKKLADWEEIGYDSGKDFIQKPNEESQPPPVENTEKK